MNIKKDVRVIGGGLMGLSTAYYLSKAGRSVVVLEKKEIGAGASGACDDMILLQSKKPGIALTLAMESLEMYRGLSDELEYDLGFQSRGGTVLIEDDRQLRVMEDYVKQQQSYGLKVDIIDKKTLKTYQPHVRADIVASTYSAEDSQVDPLRMMRALVYQAGRRGVEILRGQEVTALDNKGGHWFVSTGAGETVECDAVVNAAGAWASQIGALVGINVPIRPRKGQLAITEQIPALGKTNVWTSSYIASKIDKSLMPDRGPYAKEIGLGFSFTQTHEGNYLIGSTREDAGYDKTTSVRAIATIIQQAKEYFPVLNNVNIIRTIAGFRPYSADGNSIVGPVDGLPGFFIVAGHEGDGVALTPIMGKTMADMVLGRNQDARFDQLNLRRFGKES